MRRPVKAGRVRLAARLRLRGGSVGERGEASSEVLIRRRHAVGIERAAPLLKRAAKVIKHALLAAPGSRLGHLAIISADRTPRQQPKRTLRAKQEEVRAPHGHLRPFTA